jgi:hypothetical protein
LDKSHLERPRPLQISLTSNDVPTFDNATVDQWLSMASTYETIVQRADTAQVLLQILLFQVNLFFFFLEF